jgi:hypothetical protein
MRRRLKNKKKRWVYYASVEGGGFSLGHHAIWDLDELNLCVEEDIKTYGRTHYTDIEIDERDWIDNKIVIYLDNYKIIIERQQYFRS